MWSSYLLWFRLHWRLASRCFIIQGWTFYPLWPWRNNDLIPWRKFHWRKVFYSKLNVFLRISDFWKKKLDVAVINKTKKSFRRSDPSEKWYPNLCPRYNGCSRRIFLRFNHYWFMCRITRNSRRSRPSQFKWSILATYQWRLSEWSYRWNFTAWWKWRN